MNPRDLYILSSANGQKCLFFKNLALLSHAKQPALGCLWYAAYAVIGEYHLLAIQLRRLN
jgi:hypothetical protein